MGKYTKDIIIALKKAIASPVSKISPQEAKDKGFFGPVYHGSNEQNRKKIEREGFKVHIGDARQEGVSHGYPISNYAHGKPAPVHHLGYGIYFTTVKAIAKRFNNGITRGLKTYYLDIPKLETINFGATNTMMKWWVENGYNMPEVKDFNARGIADIRIEATKNLTNELSSKYDAVWYKGRSIKSLLDGDQIVVFDPKRIYEIDPKMAKGLEIGAKVKRKEDGMLGVIKGKRPLDPEYRKYHKGSKYLFEIKWKKGGTDLNVKDFEIEPF